MPSGSPKQEHTRKALRSILKTTTPDCSRTGPCSLNCTHSTMALVHETGFFLLLQEQSERWCSSSLYAMPCMYDQQVMGPVV